jgi:hypothetical protein
VREASVFVRVLLNFGQAQEYNLCMSKLTHLDSTGRARMVDVGDKPVTDRIAIAKGEVQMQRATFELIRDGAMKKGDVLTPPHQGGRGHRPR